MSFDDFIHVGQIGTILNTTVTKIVSDVETPVDLSTTSTCEIELQKPDGTLLSPFTATFVTDGTDGQITYTDMTGVFDVTGRWMIRGVINYASGAKFMGSWTGFSVDE
jgi:hypothetical protein